MKEQGLEASTDTLFEKNKRPLRKSNKTTTEKKDPMDDERFLKNNVLILF